MHFPWLAQRTCSLHALWATPGRNRGAVKLAGIRDPHPSTLHVVSDPGREVRQDTDVANSLTGMSGFTSCHEYASRLERWDPKPRRHRGFVFSSGCFHCTGTGRPCTAPPPQVQDPFPHSLVIGQRPTSGLRNKVSFLGLRRKKSLGISTPWHHLSHQSLPKVSSDPSWCGRLLVTYGSRDQGPAPLQLSVVISWLPGLVAGRKHRRHRGGPVPRATKRLSMGIHSHPPGPSQTLGAGNSLPCLLPPFPLMQIYIQ